MGSTFSDWTGGRTISSLGTNAGAQPLPFQNWQHFKEAFVPELIAEAVNDAQNQLPVRRCLDPFGGSGTTALACQFLGVHPVTMEVNPYLADVIEAKLSTYDSDSVLHDLQVLEGFVQHNTVELGDVLRSAPSTFIEPGLNGRWIFDRVIAQQILAFRAGIDSLRDEKHKRLFRVLLGGILIGVSNVVISGKGRRYRRNWMAHRHEDGKAVDRLFIDNVKRALCDIDRFQDRLCTTYEVLRGDCRQLLGPQIAYDLAVFSPPYPNSFDYTDVYNVELWTLGYLKDKGDNYELRNATLSSHTQISRTFAQAPHASPTLANVLDRLDDERELLWNRAIPDMVGAYFADLDSVLSRIHSSMTKGGSAWIVVGDSRYANTRIETATILAELASRIGWNIKRSEPFRSMRVSPQQGGKRELAESLIVLAKN